MSNITVEEVCNSITQELNKTNASEACPVIAPDTDLVSIGIGSLTILSVLSFLEHQYHFNLSLDIFESKGYKITPQVIHKCIIELGNE